MMERMMRMTKTSCREHRLFDNRGYQGPVTADFLPYKSYQSSVIRELHNVSMAS